MKRPVSFIIFGALAIIFNFLSARLLIWMFIMPFMYFFYKGVIFAVILSAFLLTIVFLYIASMIGFYMLKRWARNVFVVLTAVVNIFVAFIGVDLFSYESNIRLFFIGLFIYYISKQSTRKLFE
ncbi:MAG: hypothetical protein ABIG46_01685 [Candidatus Omnitrophota bacterium]